MPDPLFFSTAAPLSPQEAATIAKARLIQPAPEGVAVIRVAAASDEDLTGAAIFINDAAFLAKLGERRPAVCLVPEKLIATAEETGLPERTVVLACNSARASFALLAGALHRSLNESGEAPAGKGEAQIAPDASIAKTAIIGAGAVIGAGVRIGDYAVIGPGVQIGTGTIIGAHVTLSHAITGRDCRILSGARIGEAGFGFVMHEGRQLRIPQLGRVILGDEVEIGANTTIDRGALSDTSIGDFTKIDNLVQIGHNVVIGRNCALAAMVGISGSCVIGDGALLGGQVGLGDHVNVGDGAILYACAGVMKDIPAGEAWAGFPAKPARQFFRETATLTKLAKKKTSQG